ncbi:MAG TPA: hypothetical protein VF219_20975 [Vicinamibacterales bacterium]
MSTADPYRVLSSLTLAAMFVSGCEVTKSSNPLSPTVQGPIPGVNITAPQPVQPSGGQKIPVDQQPITLTVQNATTNGVRPLSYVFQIATDANFATIVFTKDKVAPGANGQTTLKLPDSLATDKTYYWRALAQDGANTGTYTAASSFAIYTPIVINAPALVAPAANATVDGIRPKFTFTNVTRSGPIGALTYLIEVFTDAQLTNRIAGWNVPEQPSQITAQIPVDLKYQSVYYWHVIAYVPNVAVGPWSPTYGFTTPAEPVAPPPPSGGPAGPVGPDAFNLAAASIHSSPAGVASWPVTTTITSLAVRPDGIAVEFSKKSGPGRWPDVVPPGWTGALQYTLWIAMNIGGAWHACSPIEFWYGLAASGGDITVNNQIAVNWTYYCGPMARQPAPGEMVGFFVTAGDQRLKDAAAVHERSNIVLIPFPATAGQTFTF